MATEITPDVHPLIGRRALAEAAMALAFEASQAVGMGWLHYDLDHDITEHIGKLWHGDALSADYVGGRMVKLQIKCDDETGVLAVTRPHGEPDTEYQSWARKYPTVRDLIDAAAARLSKA
jgi:hypothetical protein